MGHPEKLENKCENETISSYYECLLNVYSFFIDLIDIWIMISDKLVENDVYSSNSSSSTSLENSSKSGSQCSHTKRAPLALAHCLCTIMPHFLMQAIVFTMTRGKN